MKKGKRQESLVSKSCSESSLWSRIQKLKTIIVRQSSRQSYGGFEFPYFIEMCFLFRTLELCPSKLHTCQTQIELCCQGCQGREVEKKDDKINIFEPNPCYIGFSFQDQIRSLSTGHFGDQQSQVPKVALSKISNNPDP